MRNSYRIFLILSLVVVLLDLVGCRYRDSYIHINSPPEKTEYITSIYDLEVVHRGCGTVIPKTFKAWLDKGEEDEKDISNYFNYSNNIWLAKNFQLPPGKHRLTVQASIKKSPGCRHKETDECQFFVVAPRGTEPGIRGLLSIIQGEIAGKIVPGRIRVMLANNLWKKEFTPEQKEKKPRGLERLNLTPELAGVFQCYSLERVWRSMSQLEQRINGKIKVITYPGWVKKRRKERGMRSNARLYKVPDLLQMKSTFELKFPEETDLDDLLEALRKVPGVISAKAVTLPIPQAPYFPDDPGWVDPTHPNYDAILAQGRWGFHNTGAALGTDYLDDFDIDAPEAWEFQRGNAEVVVAVFDNGVDVTHEDLYLNIFLNNGEVPASVVNAHRGASPEDGLPNELTFYDLNVSSVVTNLASQGWSDTNGNGYIDGEDVTSWWEGDLDGDGDDDDDGNGYDDLVGWDFVYGNNRVFEIDKGKHGTPVAGLIAAVANNGTGVSGAAPKVRILPVITSPNIISSLTYALDFNAVRVINESQSYPYKGGTETQITTLLRTLEPAGVLYVASLHNGNSFTYGGDPSRREEIVSVNNFQSDGTRVTPFGSAYGPKTDVAAPGEGMYTLSARTASEPGGTRRFGGTSAASPVTAGVAALIASQDDTLSPEQIRQVLRMTAVNPNPVPGDRGENTPGWDLYSGWGMINANHAITVLRNNDIYPEANILSLPVNYLNLHRQEEFSIQTGNVPIEAYMGLPAGGSVDWTLRRSSNWDFSGAVVAANQGNASYSNGAAAIHTINTDTLSSGRYVLELEVMTPQGVIGKDRAVIDLPRAYIANLIQGQLIVHNIPIKGFAYGPGFVQYRILIAPGWSPAPSDFVEIYRSSTEQAPGLPAAIGTYLEDKTLMVELDIFSLHVTLPSSGEATIRLVTEGSSTWSFDEEIVIDNTQPNQQAGFPFATGAVYVDAPSAPTTADLDGDGTREILLAGRFVIPTTHGTFRVNDRIYAIQSNGTPLAGWPVDLPAWEFPAKPIAVGDIDNDGRPELVVRTVPDWYGETRIRNKEENIRVFKHDGTEISSSWPVTIVNPKWSYYKHDSPVLGDMTLDGRLDILVSIPKNTPNVSTARICAYAVDGNVIHTYTVGPNYAKVTQPAVGDIDGDGENEVAAVAYSPPVSGSSVGPAALYVWERDGTSAWISEISTLTSDNPAPPVLVDIDGDRMMEIIAAEAVGQVKVYDSDGIMLSSSSGTYRIFPKPVAAQLRPGVSPAEYAAIFIYQAYQSGGFAGLFNEAINPQTGGLPPGWSGGLHVSDGTVCHHPLVADLRGDDKLEIASSDFPVPSYDNVELLYYSLNIVDHSGNVVSDGNLWPLRFPTPVSSTPLVTDIDIDGNLELVVQTQDNDTRLYVYNLSTPSGPGRVAWGEYAHDPRKSGNYHGNLRILRPTTIYQESVGPYDDPSSQCRLLVRTRFSRGTPVNSHVISNWLVRVGTLEPGILDIARVQGEHWLLVEPIAQPDPGTYKLHVQFNDGGIRTWDTYRDAVRCELPTQDHTQVIVIDRSASMSSYKKMEATLVAARFFAEAAYNNDQVGVVSFNNFATDDLVNGVLNAGANRNQIATAITNLSASGRTSIGMGIAKGVNILNNTAANQNIWGMVLLSDGRENTAPYWSRSGTPPPVRPQVDYLRTSHPEFAIHTIALGPDADQDLLYKIADYTGGDFYPVYLGESLSLFNRLANVYHSAREKIDGTKRILTYGNDFNANSTWEDNVNVPQGTGRLQFGLNWDRPYYIGPYTIKTKEVIPFKFEIYRPNGRLVKATDPGVTFVKNLTDAVFTIAAPEKGKWKVRLSNTLKKTVEALLVVSASIPFHAKIIFRPADSREEIPVSTILAFVIDNQGFAQLENFIATVIHPDKKVLNIQLRDDGKSGDGAADDGIYAAKIAWALPGSYLVSVSGRVQKFEETFEISKTIGFFNRAGTDRDRDGIPDQWEQEYAPMCRKGLNPKSDPDGDGLDNITEWHFGSHPFKYDTDGDGINDGEEYIKGTDPTK
jgi:hypothetical protein